MATDMEQSYMLNWPGLQDLPIVILDPDTNTIYHDRSPLPQSLAYLNSVEFKYADIKTVMTAFTHNQRVKARKVLIDLVTNYSVKPLYRDKASSNRYIHLAALLAFVMVYPFCTSFQKARSAVFTFMMTYMETLCAGCGFVRRDCQCNNPEWKEGVSKCYETRMLSLMSEERATQTRSTGSGTAENNNGTEDDIVISDEEDRTPPRNAPPTNVIPPPPMLYLPTGQRAFRPPPPMVRYPGQSPPYQLSSFQPPPTLHNPAMVQFSSPQGHYPGVNRFHVSTAAQGFPAVRIIGGNASPVSVPSPMEITAAMGIQPNVPKKINNDVIVLDDDDSPDKTATRKRQLESNRREGRKKKRRRRRIVEMKRDEKAAEERAKTKKPDEKAESIEKEDSTKGDKEKEDEKNKEKEDGKSEDNKEKEDGKSEDNKEKEDGKSEDNKEKEDGKSEENKEEDDGKTEDEKSGENNTEDVKDSKDSGSEERKEVEKSDVQEKSEEKPDEGETKSADDVPETDNTVDVEPSDVKDAGTDGENQSPEIVEADDPKTTSETDAKVDKSSDVIKSQKEGDKSSGVDENKNTELESKVALTDESSEKPCTDESAMETEDNPEAPQSDMEKGNEKSTDDATSKTAYEKDSKSDKKSENDEKSEKSVGDGDDGTVGDGTVGDGTSDGSKTSAADIESDLESNSSYTDVTDSEDATDSYSENETSTPTAPTPAAQTPTAQTTAAPIQPPTPVEAVSLPAISLHASQAMLQAAGAAQSNRFSNLTMMDSVDAALIAHNTAAQANYFNSKQRGFKVICPKSGSSTPSAVDAAKSLLLMGNSNPGAQGKPAALPEKTMGLFDYEPTGEKLHRCLLTGCDVCFETEDHANLHEKMHTVMDKKTLKCYLCTYSTTLLYWYLMINHINTTHSETVKLAPELGCLYCGLSLKDEEELARHKSFHHYNRYRCVYCGLSFMTWLQMDKHLKESCEMFIDGAEVKFKNCQFCHLTFTKGQKIADLHINSHTDHGLKCTFCNDEIWLSWKELKSHYIKLHLGPRTKGKAFHACVVCKQKFISYIALVRHKSVEHGIKPGKPKKVKESSKSEAKALKGSKETSPEKTAPKDDKMDTTEGTEAKSGEATEQKAENASDSDSEKEVKEVKARKWLYDDEIESAESSDENEAEEKGEEAMCKVCEKSFRNSRMLRWHMDYEHSKKVKCRECGFMAKSQAVMRSHKLQRHADISRHKCRLCGETFAHYHQYKVHKKQHKKGFPCQQCNQNFPCRTTLNEHTLTEHPPKPKGPLLTCAQEECEYTCYSRSTMKSHVLRAHPQVAKENGADHCYFTLDQETNTKVAQSTRTLFSPSKRAKHRRLTIIRRKGIKKGKRPLLVKTLPGARTSNRLAIKVQKKDTRTRDELIRDMTSQPLKRRGCARFRPYEEASKLKYRDPNYQELHPHILDKGLEMMGRLVPEVLDVQAALHGRRLEPISSGRPHKVIDAKMNLITSKSIASSKIVLLDHNYMKPMETTTAHVPALSPPSGAYQPPAGSSGSSVQWGSDLMIVDTPDVGQFADIDSRRKAMQEKSQRTVYKRGIGEDYLQGGGRAMPGGRAPPVGRTPSGGRTPRGGTSSTDDDVELEELFYKQQSPPRGGPLQRSPGYQRPVPHTPHRRLSGTAYQPNTPHRQGGTAYQPNTPHRQGGTAYQPITPQRHGSGLVRATTPHRYPSGTTLVDALDDGGRENYEDMLSGLDDFLKSVGSSAIREEDVAALVEGDTGNFVLDSSPLKHAAQQPQQHHSQGKQISSVQAVQHGAHPGQQHHPGQQQHQVPVAANPAAISETAEALLSLQAPFDLAMSEQQQNSVVQSLQGQTIQGQTVQGQTIGPTESVIGNITVAVPINRAEPTHSPHVQATQVNPAEVNTTPAGHVQIDTSAPVSSQGQADGHVGGLDTLCNVISQSEMIETKSTSVTVLQSAPIGAGTQPARDMVTSSAETTVVESVATSDSQMDSIETVQSDDR